MKIFVCLGLALLWSMTANAQVYKWVDEHGKIQYGDQPPPGIAKDRQRLNLRTTTPSNPPESNKSKSLSEEREEFDKRQKQRKEEEVKQLAKTEENKKKCLDAQTQLRVYTDSPRLTVPDGSGGVSYVDDDARQRKINDANKAISTFCK
ncbi:MAG: DUF4124 domain-containing protein [Nitrosomonas sp.]|nr:DUF4124 domain-containing protein [Nitrosomonas sp.]